MLIKRYLFALIKRHKLLFVTMALISAVTFSMFVGSNYAFENYKISVDNYFNNYSYPSAFISTALTNNASFDDLSSVEGLKDYDVRFSSLFNANIKDEFLTVVLSTYKKNDFSKFAYMSDHVDGENIEIFVDKQFADIHNIKAGDTMTIGKKGHFCTCTVGQIILKPENFCVYALGDVKTDNIGYGAVFLNHADLAQFLASIQMNTFGMDSNQVLLSIDPSFDKQTVLDNCCDKLSKNINIISAVKGEDTPPLLLSNEFNTQFSAISQAVPLANLIIMSLIFVLFLIQIIKRNCREIGVFLTAGFQKTSVYLLFALFTLVMSFFSIVVGLLLSVPIGGLLYHLYQGVVFLPDWTQHISFDNILLSSLIITVSGQIACILSALAFIKSSPMDALEKNHQKYISLGKKLELFIYKIPTAFRLALNSILQNFRNFFVIVIGYIAAFVLIFSSFSLFFSLQEYMSYTYDIQNNYDVQVVSLLSNSEEIFNELKENDNVKRMQTYDRATVDITYGDKTKSTVIIDFPADNDMLKFKDAYTGQDIGIPEKGILIDQTAAEYLGVKPGCFVEVGNKKLEVIAITAIYCEQRQVVSVDQMEQLDAEKTKCALVNISDKEKFEELCASSDCEFYPIFSSNLKQMEVNFKKSINIIITITVSVAMLLGFIVVCTVNKMTLDKQKRTISILQSQGMSLTAISNYWSIQMVIQLILSFLIGIPLASFVGKQFVGKLCTDVSYFPFINDYRIYLLSFSFIIAFSVAAHFVIVYLISRFNIARNIQSRE